MKTKFLKAFIIDQDTSQGRAMAQLIMDLFSKVHFSQNITEIHDELKENKSRIIFFNLNVSQRTSNFEILEKLSISDEFQTVIFGYTDTYEPELIAHAIEHGFQDIFTKPFDADIVATKINKFIQYERTQGRELNHQPLNPPFSGTVHLPLKVSSVDENGISFRTEHYVSKGTIFRVSDPIVQEIFENPSMELMVTKTWMGDNYGDHFLYTEPRVPSEKHSAALRRFILRKL